MKADEFPHQMEIDEFTSRFFEMEMEGKLFFRFGDIGEPLWDVVRFEVFLSLFNHVAGDRPPAQAQAPISRRRRLADIPSGLKKLKKVGADWVRLKRLRGADFVAFNCSRYADSSGSPVDFASQDALQVLASMGTVQMIETHPWVKRDVNITAFATILAHIKNVSPKHRERALALASAVAEAQRTWFGKVDPRLSQTIASAYKTFLVQRQTWAEILDRSRPRGILMTQNGIQKGLLYEARRRGIPVVECQHGVINLMHPAYSYPPLLRPGDHLALPDTLLLFSDYWVRQCRMPGTRTIPVGNTRFCSNGVRSSRKGPAIFVSAGVFHPYLSPVAAEIAQRMPDRKFIVKLHPAQTSERSAIEAEYRNIPNLSVIAMEKSMPELLSDASDVIIIQSTAAYQALDRGVPVHVLMRPGHRSHSDLFSRPDVHLVENAQELQTVLFRPSPAMDALPPYFQSFSVERFCACLEEIGISRTRSEQH